MFSPKEIVRSGLCIGCGSCVSQSHNTRMQFDAYGNLKPLGPDEWYNQTAESFSRTCPFSPNANNEDELSTDLFPDAPHFHKAIGRYVSNWVGHVKEDDFRSQGSSGGMVSWVASELLRKDLIDGVAHVVATKYPQSEGKFFHYRISHNESEIREGAKSRYYPVELSEVLKIIRDVPGRYAIVAVPCMIKAVQLLRKENSVYRERIRFTLGLFCGHMKSARFVGSFAWQMNVPLQEIKSVDFRYKYPNRPANWYNAMLKLHDGREVNKDWWHLKDGDWGAGFFMNSACNFCDDVVAETADISFGDAWVEPYASDGRGTNVIVVRSGLIENIITEGIKENRLQLQKVDDEFVEQTQAAGLRQRREGLAYRLSWSKKGIQPIKRVLPADKGLTPARKRIYKMRFLISKWSHRFFLLSAQLRKPSIYLLWARTVAAIYYGIAYHQSSFGDMKKRFNELGR